MTIITKYYPRLPGQKRTVRERYVVDENGVKQGLYQSYYRNGQDEITCTYKNDVPNGPYVSKHSNGRVAMECTYDEGCLEGKVTRHDKMGGLLFVGNYHRNMSEGEQTYYRPNGELYMRENRHMGLREGECVTFYGEEISRAIYENNTVIKVPQLATGRTTKIVQEFSDNALKRQISYVYNAENVLEEKKEFYPESDFDRCTYYFPNGKERLVCQKHGESKEGPYTRFFESGRKAEEGIYKRNLANGNQTFYYDNATNSKREESSSVDGKLNGDCTRYDEAGRIAEKCRYKNGNRIISPEMSEILFNKKVEREVRDLTAREILGLRRRGMNHEAVLLTRQFHLSQVDIPRRTALKIGQENCRV